MPSFFLDELLQTLRIPLTALSEITGPVAALLSQGPAAPPFTGIQLDSRKLKPCEVFLAFAGVQGDGRVFIDAALQAGAALVLAEKTQLNTFLSPDTDLCETPCGTVSYVPQKALLGVKHLAQLLPELAALAWPLSANSFHYGSSKACFSKAYSFKERPDQGLQNLIAITGTNGKTTVSHFIASALQALQPQQPVGLAGTLGIGQLGHLLPTPNTTVDRLSLQRWLHDLEKAGARTAILEASSHALDQKRLQALPVTTAVWTNLTHDHLDYHQTLERYYQAKKRCFTGFKTLKTAVINLDDPYGRHLIAEQAYLGQLFTYSAAGDPKADLYCQQVRLSAAGIECQLYYSDDLAESLEDAGLEKGGSLELSLNYWGRFNLENVLAALAVLLLQDVPVLAAVKAIAQAGLPMGRMYRVLPEPSPPKTCDPALLPVVIVDYAHTPDALTNVLQALRAHTHHHDHQSRLWCVFGCGGDRDKSKRAAMGMVAAQLADQVVLTTDNPRTELPAAIVEQITADLLLQPSLLKKVVACIEDRKRAIYFAVTKARPGDIVLLAGKGHEQYQIIGAQTQYFCDTAQAGAALSERQGLLSAG